MIFFDWIYILAIVFCSMIYWLLPDQKLRIRFLIIVCFVGLVYVQLKFTLILLALVLFVFYMSLKIERHKKYVTTMLIITLIVIFLVVAKYLHVFYGIIFQDETGLSQKYLIPLGVSYLSFKLIAYILDVYRGTIKSPNVEELLAFILFIPIFPAGPIERYQGFIENRIETFDLTFYLKGIQRIMLGYFKKVVIVNFIIHEIVVVELYQKITANGVSMDLPVNYTLFFLFGSLMYAYLDMSSYADIAIGFSKLFGFTIMENMNYPIFRRNLSEYWNNWHMSLSSWCRNNVYFTILGSTRNIYLAMYCSFLVMGLWHKVNLNWVLWGIWHASGVLIYSHWSRFLRKKKIKFDFVPKRIRYAVSMLLTVFYASVGYSVLMLDSPYLAGRLLASMFL